MFEVKKFFTVFLHPFQNIGVRCLFTVSLLFLSGLFGITYSQSLSAFEIVKKSNGLFRAESCKSIITIDIVRPSWQRTYKVHLWIKGSQYCMAVITDPPKESGQVFLKCKDEFWNWQPSIQRMIKLPLSMMAEGWMSSDLSNDDLLSEVSAINEYEPSIVRSESIGDVDCYVIRLTPKSNVSIVWGSVVKWIAKNNYFPMKSEYFDEDNSLVRTEVVKEIRNIGGKLLPAQYEIIPADKLGNKTIVTINSIAFNITLKESFFSKQNMKRIYSEIDVNSGE
jgi:outer membrane lipoprotein-sorting protein